MLSARFVAEMRTKTAGVFFATAIGACNRDLVAPPVVPLDLVVTAHTLDGKPLPAVIEEAPGRDVNLLQFGMTLKPDGNWFAFGQFRPTGAAPSLKLPEFWDNGWYTYDGAELRVHSNLTHTE